MLQRVCPHNQGPRRWKSLHSRFDWLEHSEMGCSVCECLGSVKRGRKQRKISSGRPPHQLIDLVEHIKQRSPPSQQLDLPLREDLSSDPATVKDLKCPLCHLVLDRPILLTTCNQLVCMTCCISHLYQHTDLSCPICGQKHILDTTTVVPAPTVVLKVLSDLEITCKKCNRQAPAGIQYFQGA